MKAKLLEQKLTGHIDLEERKNQEGESQKQRVGVLSHPEENTEVLEENLLSGLDFILSLSISPEEMSRRIKGRRQDPQTSIIYHIEDNPPPTDVKGLNERLIAVVDEFSDGKAENMYEGFMKNLEEMKAWYQRFGKVSQDIEGHGKLFEVFERIDKHISNVLSEKHEEYDILIGDKQREEVKDSEENANENKGPIFEPSALNQDASKMLWTIWDDTQNNYLKEIYKTLNKMKENR